MVGICQRCSGVVATYKDILEFSAFASRVRSFTVKEVVRMARERNHGVLGYTKALVIFYNKKKKGNKKSGHEQAVRC